MNGYDSYVMFLAMKRHFTPGSGYDYHKYNGKIKASPSAYENLGNARFLFEKLGRHRDPERLLVAVLSHNPKAWIGDVSTQEAEDRYNRLIKVLESLSYHAKRDLSQFDPWLGFDDIFTFRDGEYPPALDALMDGTMHPEVVVAMDKLTGGMILRHWEKQSWDPVVRQEVSKLRALSGFVEIDSPLLKETVKNAFVRESSPPK